MPVQTDLAPTTQQEAIERLAGIVAGYWEDGGSETKVHLIESVKTRYLLQEVVSLCRCPHPRVSAKNLGRAIEMTECGNCKRIYYALVRKAFWGK